jgi:6-phosphogluconolactonase
MSESCEVYRFPQPVLAAEACAKHILQRLEAAILERGAATLAISGGSSPKPMFQDFAHRAFPWDRVHLFWVDERGVPPTDSQSNFKLAFDTWLDAGKFPPSNIHRIQAELKPEEAARLYRNEIRRHFDLPAGGLPHFDVIHRGIGPEGHTASLFPGEPLIRDHTTIAAEVWVEKMHQWRITLLPGTLEAARHTVMLVAGADKTEVVRTVIEGAYEPDQYPAQIASRGSTAAWFMDEAAAAGLSKGVSA